MRQIKPWKSRTAIALSMALLALIGDIAADDIASKKNEMVMTAKKATTSIPVEKLAKMIESGETVNLLDIRTQAEYDQGHIRTSKWTPRGKLEFLAAQGQIGPADSKIIVYCKEEGRASLAAKTLMDLGFADVAYLEGGFRAWVGAGQSIYNMHGELTVKNFERPEAEE